MTKVFDPAVQMNDSGVAWLGEIPALVAQDKAVQNALNMGDEQNIRMELARAMQETVGNSVADLTDLYEHYADDPVFKALMLDMAFQAVYSQRRGDSGRSPAGTLFQ